MKTIDIELSSFKRNKAKPESPRLADSRVIPSISFSTTAVEEPVCN